ncbi:hypothetical protein MN116_001877 [Schistosoma mekongi]|uniref:EF-hand domain-containing protein n=1 Tax=Schistosoma mekongi TaxID=38744 RepID=A0AAE1ZIV5_SCHME|nr:hypothetical protein MN116_001877 [Schistosoma mekongi]
MSSYLHQVFNNYCCFDGSHVDKEGCKLLFIELYGRKPNKEEMKLILSLFESNSNGELIGLTFTGFLSCIQMFQKHFQNNLPPNESHNRLSFDCLDLSSKDFVVMNDLRQVMYRYFPTLPSGLSRTIFREFDQDYDDRVSYEDYLLTTKLYVSTFSYIPMASYSIFKVVCGNSFLFRS